MPLYDFRCEEHGKFETIAKWDEAVACKICGVECRRLMSVPAKTRALWNGGWTAGLTGSGFYSYSAGQHVNDHREEEKIMKSRGFVNERDLGGDNFYEKYTESKKEENRKLDAEAARYRENLAKFEGDKVRAVTETWQAKDMLQQAAEHDAKVGAA